jgi:nicotinamidase-related amidase
MKPALLVIDVQRAFFRDDLVAAGSLDEAAECINAAIALFRSRGLPVVSVQQVDEDVTDLVDVLDSDLHIHKSYGNAFNKTPLKQELRRLDVDTVVLTGFCAEHCVLSTYRGAEDLDLTPIILRDSLVSRVRENIGFVESMSDVISYGALAKVLG